MGRIHTNRAIAAIDRDFAVDHTLQSLLLPYSGFGPKMLYKVLEVPRRSSKRDHSGPSAAVITQARPTTRFLSRAIALLPEQRFSQEL